MNTCSGCRFWHRHGPPPREGLVWPSTDWGDCWLLGDDASLDNSRPPVDNPPKLLACLQPFAGADGAGFDTHETFGCVQWEARA